HSVDIFHEAGLTYCCDWVNDELPYSFNNGMINVPLNHELSDRQIIAVQQQSVESWQQSMEDAYDWLEIEATQQGGGRMLPIHLTPYIMGLPYRISALEALLDKLNAQAGAWFARGEDIVAAWDAQQ
ncbi:MAG: polysaccharide deacetylase, partial [Sphingomonadaceae bacterium]